MKDNVQVSVIIPAHNAENNIKECLNSIVNQTLRDIEIICVNDGSTDATESIIRGFMKEDERISIINQPNLYAGVARNAGMTNCHGKYMIFWDADDIFELTALEELYRKIEEDQADICICDADQYDDGSGQILKKSYLNMERIPEKLPFSINDNPQFIFNFTTDVPWNKLLRREFVQKHELQFQNLPRANDHYFVLLSLALAQRITVVDKHLIKYRVNNEESLTGNLSASPFCTYEALLAAKRALEELKILDNEQIRKSFANRALNSITYSMEKQSDFAAFKAVFDKMKSEGFLELGIEEKEADYYYAAKVYEKYSTLISKPLEEFLFFEYSEQKIQWQRLKIKCNLLFMKYERLKTQNKELNKEFKKYKKELEGIKKSRGYRILQVFYNLKRKIIFWR